MDTISIKVEGMTCGHCEMTVKKVLLKLKGVKNASVSHESNSADVITKTRTISPEDLIQAVEAAGYKASIP